MKIDLEKLICSFLKGDLTDEQKLRANEKFEINRFVNAVAVKWNLVNALKEQGIEYKDGKLSQIENEPEVKSFVESIDDPSVKIPIHHPKTYCHLLKDALPLTKEGQYIAIERVQVETLEEFRNKVASLGESKPFLPLIDNEIERLLALEQLHLSHIVGFLVPKETRFVEKH